MLIVLSYTGLYIFLYNHRKAPEQLIQKLYQLIAINYSRKRGPEYRPFLVFFRVICCMVSHVCPLAFSYDIVIWAFFFFWLLCIFLPECGLSPAAASREHSLVLVTRFLTVVASPAAEHGLQYLQCPGSRAQAQQLRCTDFVASWHVETFQTRDQTHVLAGGFSSTVLPGKSCDRGF